LPFQVIIEKNNRVAIPLEYVQGLKLKEGDYLTLDIVPLLGGQKSFKQLETDLSYAQDYEITVQTLGHFIPIWLANFKKNLPRFVKDAKSYSHVLPVEGDKKRCMVVANGPSLYDTDLSCLKDFKGTVVSANKPLKHLLEHGIVPDWVAVLDAEEVVLKSFDHDIVREFARAIQGIFLPTVVNPKVAAFVLEHFGADKTYWHNPHFSDAIAPNICETLTSITSIPSCEHGGNVGTFAYLMSIRPLMCNPIGLLGFDLSYKPSKKWSQEQTTHYRFFYIPDLDQHYAMSPVFEYYVSRLIDLWNISAEKQGTRTYNLTPVGPLNAVIGFPRSSLSEFCSDSQK